MNFKKASSTTIVLAALLAACASPPRGVVTENCVSDPPNFLELVPELKAKGLLGVEQIVQYVLDRASLQCVSKIGFDYTVSWKDSANYVCRPAEDDELLNLKAR